MSIKHEEHYCKLCKKWIDEFGEEAELLYNPSDSFYICENCLKELREILTHQHEDKGE